jgi:hypothetical protein
LQSRCSTAWTTPQVHFVLVILEIGVLWTICLSWPGTLILPISASQVARITVSHWHPAVQQILIEHLLMYLLVLSCILTAPRWIWHSNLLQGWLWPEKSIFQYSTITVSPIMLCKQRYALMYLEPWIKMIVSSWSSHFSLIIITLLNFMREIFLYSSFKLGLSGVVSSQTQSMH